jgi:hypothetical protein
MLYVRNPADEGGRSDMGTLYIDASYIDAPALPRG